MMADPVTDMVYISTRGHLIAMDLTTEKIVWNNTYETGHLLRARTGHA